MDYRFSDKVLALKPNAIREILKSASDPDVISLSAGNPAPDAFPVDMIREISAQTRTMIVRRIISFFLRFFFAFAAARLRLSASEALLVSLKLSYGMGRLLVMALQSILSPYS